MDNGGSSPSSGNAAVSKRRRPLLMRTVALTLAVLVALLMIETVLHWFPMLVPAAIRHRYAPHGVEFLVPGLLDRTPAEAVPLPSGMQPFEGQPPHDTADSEVALNGLGADRHLVPLLKIPADKDGLTNARRPTHPDLVLVGDSFATMAGQTYPPGLVAGLEKELDIEILNLGIPGIGPIHESWLLNNVGIPTKPRAIVWLFYGGNDFQDTFFLVNAIEAGAKTHGDLRKTRRPFWILPEVASLWLSKSPKSNRPQLDPFYLQGSDSISTWFFPDTLRFMAMSKEMLKPSPAAQAITTALANGRDAAAKIQAEFLVVFIPSKEQSWLPSVSLQPDLLMKYLEASTLKAVPIPDSPTAAAALLRKNCNALESVIAAWCNTEKVNYWSATETLREAVTKGKMPYYRADSHWRAEGQAACLDALVSRLKELGLGR